LEVRQGFGATPQTGGDQIGKTIYKEINRVKKEIIKEFKKLPTTIISDAMNRTNVMKALIKPLIENIHIAGSAITVKCIVGDNIMTHQALYLAKPGDVLVIDARGYVDTSIWGGIQTEVAKKLGIAGVVIDGSIRDVLTVRRLKYPIFCCGVVSAGPHKGFGDSINVPIQCGGVPVNPGDIVVGDDDGVVVVPRKNAEEVLKRARERLKMEKEWMKKINKGETTLKAIGLDKKIEQMQITFLDKYGD
jgi:regulator of RNase E activity RraA